MLITRQTYFQNIPTPLLSEPDSSKFFSGHFLVLYQIIEETLSFQAVENSFCVLVCVTEKYKESSACRSEAEYSYNLKRDIVPLMMEKGYTPSGSLIC